MLYDIEMALERIKRLQCQEASSEVEAMAKKIRATSEEMILKQFRENPDLRVAQVFVRIKRTGEVTIANSTSSTVGIIVGSCGSQLETNFLAYELKTAGFRKVLGVFRLRVNYT